MNFSKFIFVTSESNQDGTVPPIKNNTMISVTRPIIKYTDSNPPPPNETTKTFHDQMIEICRNNNIQLTHDDNLIGLHAVQFQFGMVHASILQDESNQSIGIQT
jgi:hypothetical protein